LVVSPRLDLADALKAFRARVSLVNPNVDASSSDYRVLTGPLHDPNYAFKAIEGHELVFFEAEGSEQVLESGPWLIGLIHLLEAARRYRVHQFVYASSDSPANQMGLRFATDYVAQQALPVLLAHQWSPQQILSELETRLSKAR
jgi:nucleoside-diphosphate-sugar epimerase